MLQPLLPDSARPHVRWGQLYGGSAALAIAEAAARTPGPLLVIAEGAREAERLQGEIAFFAGSQVPVRLFPDWETLPYDVSRRTRTSFPSGSRHCMTCRR